MWAVIAYEDDEGRPLEVHIIPEHDDEEHVESRICWCGPVWDGEDPPGYSHRDLLKREGPVDPESS